MFIHGVSTADPPFVQGGNCDFLSCKWHLRSLSVGRGSTGVNGCLLTRNYDFRSTRLDREFAHLLTTEGVHSWDPVAIHGTQEALR